MSINNRSGKHSFGTIRPRLTILQNRYYFRDIPEGQIAGPNAPYPNTRSIGLRVWSLSLYIYKKLYAYTYRERPDIKQTVQMQPLTRFAHL